MKQARVAVALGLALSAVVSNIGQQATAASSFDVVSIRQVNANSERRDQSEVEIMANGWRLNDEPLFAAIINAYTPTAGGASFYTIKQVQGLPEWAHENRYVIEAKIEENDMAKWHDTHAQADLLHAMLRSMLEERCKIVVHHEMKEVPIYLLSLAKDGPKFKEAVPGAPHPAAGAIPGGGEFRSSDGNGVMHFYEAPITAVAGVLSNMTGRSVQDATGLTGRYDVALKMPSLDSSTQGSDNDSGGSVSSVVGDIGLKLVPAKGKVEVLVIDHIEKPSDN